jgi:Proline dehydrogenase
VTTDLEQAKRQNFYFGAKLVRGAYIEQERARSATLKYDDPTNPSFEATTEMYHKTLTECLRRIKVGGLNLKSFFLKFFHFKLLIGRFSKITVMMQKGLP